MFIFYLLVWLSAVSVKFKHALSVFVSKHNHFIYRAKTCKVCCKWENKVWVIQQYVKQYLFCVVSQCVSFPILAFKIMVPAKVPYNGFFNQNNNKNTHNKCYKMWEGIIFHDNKGCFLSPKKYTFFIINFIFIITFSSSNERML